MSTVHNPNSEKWETLANNVIYHLKSDYHLSDDEIPKKAIHSVPETVIYLQRDVDKEYVDGQKEYGNSIDKTNDDRVCWQYNQEGADDHSVVSVDDMISMLMKVKKEVGSDARLSFISRFTEESEWRIGGSDTWEYEVTAWKKTPETWEAYYERLCKFRDNLEEKIKKTKEEDDLIKNVLPEDVDIKTLTESERRELLLSIYRINAIKNKKGK